MELNNKGVLVTGAEGFIGSHLTEMLLKQEESEVEQLLCDNSSICKLTGWRSEITLEEGLRKTIEWFKNKGNLIKYKWNIYNV